jgi:hypothetical protein
MVKDTARGMNLIQQANAYRKGSRHTTSFHGRYKSGSTSNGRRYGGHGRRHGLGNIARGPGINFFLKNLRGGVKVYQGGAGRGEESGGKSNTEFVGRNGAGTRIYQLGGRYPKSKISSSFEFNGGYPKSGSFSNQLGGGRSNNGQGSSNYGFLDKLAGGSGGGSFAQDTGMGTSGYETSGESNYKTGNDDYFEYEVPRVEYE